MFFPGLGDKPAPGFFPLIEAPISQRPDFALAIARNSDDIVGGQPVLHRICREAAQVISSYAAPLSAGPEVAIGRVE